MMKRGHDVESAPGIWRGGQHRWAKGRNERFAEILAELVRLKVDVIVSGAFPCPRDRIHAVRAIKRPTKFIWRLAAAAGQPSTAKNASPVLSIC
jgi:hypothetical protein